MSVGTRVRCWRKDFGHRNEPKIIFFRRNRKAAHRAAFVKEAKKEGKSLREGDARS